MIRSLLVALILVVSVASAAETPASEASIKEILRVTEAQKLLDGMFSQVDLMMRSAMQEALKGHTVSPEEQMAIDRMSAKMLAMMKEEMSWEKLEPLYLSIYQKSFTQEEVDGMLAFYRSSAGTALIKKMPVVIQHSMSAMRERMGPMMQKIQAAVEETVAEIADEPQKGAN